MSTPKRPPNFRPRRERRTAVVLVLGAMLFGLDASLPRASAQEADPGFRIVVHPENPASRLPRGFLANLFLKEVTRWDDGAAARPADLKPDAPARKRFSGTVLNRSVAAVKSYWQQRIFSGRGVPPPELESDQAVVQYVLKHRGAVGYVSPGTDIGKAKLVRVE